MHTSSDSTRAPRTEQPDKVKLNYYAYQAIKNDIIEGVLQPGTLISENELAEKLGISRTPVREALHRLESDRFLRIYPKRGIFVPDISVKDVRDLYSIRAVLEPFAARLATKAIRMEEVERYKRLFEQDIPTPREFLVLDQEFHNLIVKSSNNEYLISLLLEFYDHLQRLRNLIAERIYRARDLIHAEHLVVIEALQTRDEEQVESAMKKHLLNAADRMTRSFILDGNVGSTT
jgi:DNA-binding GntR family transcriptional regulator